MGKLEVSTGCGDAREVVGTFGEREALALARVESAKGQAACAVDGIDRAIFVGGVCLYPGNLFGEGLAIPADDAVSSNIETIGSVSYEHRFCKGGTRTGRIVEVRFKGGRTYRYHDPDGKAWEAYAETVRECGSVGRAFALTLKRTPRNQTALKTAAPGGFVPIG